MPSEPHSNFTVQPGGRKYVRIYFSGSTST